MAPPPAGVGVSEPPAPARSQESPAPARSQESPASANLAPTPSGEAARGEEPQQPQAPGPGQAVAAGPQAETEQPPSPLEAMAPTVTAITRRAAQTARHSPAPSTVANAQAAAMRPATEQQRSAALATVNKLDSAQESTQDFERAAFRAALREAIEKATPTPTTEEKAHEVVESGAQTASATLQGQLAGQKDAAVGPLRQPGDVRPQDLGPEPPQVALQPEQVGEMPAPVSAAAAVPPALPPERLDYSEDRQATNQAMEENGVSRAQLEKGNEPEFGQTLEARSQAEQHEAQAATTYRASEADLRAGAKSRAQGTLAGGLTAMHGARAVAIGKVAGRQVGTMTKDEGERRRVTATIEGIKNQTRADVDTILKEMDSEASRIFGEGLTAAERAYEEVFEEEKGGVGTWLTTWGSDWEELIESSLKRARDEYLRQVDIAIDKVADCVDTKLAAAKKRVIEGRAQVRAFVDGLDQSVRAFGQEALTSVEGEFDAMTQTIDARRDALVDNLTTQFTASYERMSAKEQELREANKSLWQRVYDATVGVIQKILAFKDLLLSILAKASDVVGNIITDPIGFLGNLVAGVALGLENFVANIGKHLQKGLMDWLFGALGKAGITMPETLDLQGIVSIALQVLGLTYANFRARAVKIVGEPVVSALEKTAEVFTILVTEGVPGLWRFVKEKLAELKSMVLDAIWDFIKGEVIEAGIAWLVGLLNPASAFFKACKAIYDIIMFFINRGSQIVDLVNAVLDSVGAVAKGSIGVAAKFVEDALAKAIPVAIGFLASLLGLGDISATIRKTIDKARAPVDEAIDWVIGQAVKLVKAAGKLIGGALGKKKRPDEVAEDDPEKAAKVEAGLAAIDAEEESRLEEERLTREAAEAVAATVRKDHPVFTSITVIDAEGRWDYDYVASPGKKKEGALHAEDSGIIYLTGLDSVEPVLSDVGRLEHGVSSPQKRDYSSAPKVLERDIGESLARATSLPLEGKDDPWRMLTTKGATVETPDGSPDQQPPPASLSPTPDRRLLEQPTVTSPMDETWDPLTKRGKRREHNPAHSVQPDFLLVGPKKIEVFEVTLDASFRLGRQEKGMKLSKGAKKYHVAHKIEQLANVEHLARRFPGLPIVFNIQTGGQPLFKDGEVQKAIEVELRNLRTKFAKEGLGNTVTVAWRT
ncbi:hypothetical protein [Modestobacter marinus]|uniref:hypothetical protein n=1 Tax=Modestobacter marinus TaxID=477641 RepID=UPI001C95CE1A|nr:hypothetical protein [Modestobacter marinus]